MWTELKLAKLQEASELLGGDKPSRTGELARLARIGLAAERTGWATFSAATFAFGEFCAPEQGREARMSLDAFLNHPAWRKE